MSRPLYDAIVKLNKTEKCSLHMPAHNCVGDNSPLYASSIFDLTELNGLDNLLESNGVIKQSENFFANDFQCLTSLMLTEGSTVGNQIVANILKQRGGKIAIVGTNHKSIWNACILWNIQYEYFEDIAEFVAKFAPQKKFGSVFITSPDYFGNCKDIESLSAFCKENSLLLAVDSAHGAHFPFSKLLPQSPTKFADLAVCSLHKTMASYGGGAILNINNQDLVPYAIYFRQIIHSTSPSYLVMASMDYSRDLWEKNGEKFYKDIKIARQKFAEQLPFPFVLEKSDDLSRLVVSAKDIDAHKALEELNKIGIFPEMASDNKIVSILTPFNIAKLEQFAIALGKIPLESFKKIDFNLHLAKSDKISQKLGFVKLDDAVGKVSANELGLYPPGVPIVHRGEIFDTKTIKIIKDFQSYIFGLVNDSVVVLE